MAALLCILKVAVLCHKLVCLDSEFIAFMAHYFYLFYILILVN